MDRTSDPRWRTSPSSTARCRPCDDVSFHVNEQRDRRPARRQRRRQVDADQGPVGRGAADQRRDLHPRQEGRHRAAPPTPSPTASRRSTRTRRWCTQLSIARNLFLGREPLNGPRFLNRMDQDAMNQVARELLKQRRHHQEHPAHDADRLALGRRAPGGGDRPRHAFRQRPDHPRRADQQSRRRRDARRAELRARTRRDPAIPASSSPTTSTTSSRWSTASWSCARGKVVADDIDPKKTTIEEVERDHHRHDRRGAGRLAGALNWRSGAARSLAVPDTTSDAVHSSRRRDRELSDAHRPP